MNRTAIPWTLTVLLALYVFGLEYLAKHQASIDPSIEFYDTTKVKVMVFPEQEEGYYVFGQFNNILEGSREQVEAKQSDQEYTLTFEVNSPRPARLFVNDEVLEIFLVPGDTTLGVSVFLSPDTDLIDSVDFKGPLANVCSYYLDKAQRFGQIQVGRSLHLLSFEDMEVFAHQLDSMSNQELAFLAEQEVFSSIPSWFAMFEKNEILYQRAYLKLSSVYNRQVSQGFLDEVLVNNPKGVFSYYYYLYLQVYFNSLESPRDFGSKPREDLFKQMSLADSLLSGGPKDVFMTRTIFGQITNKEKEGGKEVAQELLDTYEKSFSSPKYVRFLEKEISELK